MSVLYLLSILCTRTQAHTHARMHGRDGTGQACNEVAWFSIGIDSACEVVAYLQWAKQHALDTPESTRLLSRLTAHTAPRQTWRRREMRMRRPLMLPTAVEVDREYRSTAEQNSHPDVSRFSIDPSAAFCHFWILTIA